MVKQHNNTETPVDLYYVHMYTLETNECRERLQGHIALGHVTNTTVCTVRNTGTGVCFGDSGGPWVLNNKCWCHCLDRYTVW